MQPAHVDFARVGFKDGSGDRFGAQDRNALEHVLGRDRGDRGHQPPCHLEFLLEQLQLIGAGDRDEASRRQQRVVAEVLRRLFEKRPARHRQASNQAVTIVLGKTSG